MNALTFVEIWLSLLTIWLQIVSGYSIKDQSEGAQRLRQRRSATLGDGRDFGTNYGLAQLLRGAMPRVLDRVRPTSSQPFASDYPPSAPGQDVVGSDGDDGGDDGGTGSLGDMIATIKYPQDSESDSRAVASAEIKLLTIPKKRQQAWHTPYGKRTAAKRPISWQRLLLNRLGFPKPEGTTPNLDESNLSPLSFDVVPADLRDEISYLPSDVRERGVKRHQGWHTKFGKRGQGHQPILF